MVKANKMKSKIRKVLMERLQLIGDLMHEAPDTPATKAIMFEIILIANVLGLDIGQDEYVAAILGVQAPNGIEYTCAGCDDHLTEEQAVHTSEGVFCKECAEKNLPTLVMALQK